LQEEHAARQQAEQERDRVVLGRQEAEERLRAMTITQVTQAPTNWLQRTRKNVNAKASDRASDRHAADPGAISVEGSATVRKRHGRPSKANRVEAGFIEWWKPGWRDRFR
jgi:hypothetical protein